MRRRHLLVLSAGALAAPALITQPARAAVETREQNGYRIRTYNVRPGSGSRDVACNADGTVWFCGQRDGTLNLLDPRDGGLKVVALGQGAAPHGVIVGPDGAAWVTEGGQNSIARVDPKDHKVQLWKLNGGPSYANLNTLVFDKQGTLWFTGQGGVIGRFEPKSREDAGVGRAARQRPVRHRAHAAGHGLVRVARRQLSRRDRPRDRHAAHRRAADAAAGRAPRVVRQPGAAVDQRMEQRQRLDARSVHQRGGDGSWKKWKLPGERPRCYSVYVDDRDAVWLTDFAANAIVRFDPKTETFLSFPSRQVGRQRAPDGGTAGRGVGRRVGHQPHGRHRQAASLIACAGWWWRPRSWPQRAARAPRPATGRSSSTARPAMRSSKDAGQKPGPQLAGVIGRPVAGDPAFDYSPVLQEARAKGEVWTKDKLDLYLSDPQAVYAGTWMGSPPIRDAKQRADILCVLGGR